jgi:putative membrane protein
MENLKLANKLNKYAVVVSAAVLILVASMRQIKVNLGIDFSFLPTIYSITNALAAVFLVRAIMFIKQKRIAEHKQMIMIALSLSAAFLLMYVLYHITNDPVEYCGEGLIRNVYFTLLISHVVLAAVSFPFILFTFIRGFTMQVEKHKAMSKYVFWVWLYVSITGPIVYLMLRPCI